MNKIITLLAITILSACSNNPYNKHYYKNHSLHPELLEIHKNECIKLGFKANSTKLAECRKDMAQDWKNNLESSRRDREIRPSFGIHYGIGGGRW